MEEDGPTFRKCSRCGKTFKSRKSADQHIRDKHKGVGHRVQVRQWQDGEKSMADMVVDARIAYACGEPVDDWLMDMFEDDITAP